MKVNMVDPKFRRKKTSTTLVIHVDEFKQNHLIENGCGDGFISSECYTYV